MLTKEELNNLRYMAKDIKALEDELAVLYTKVEGLSSPIFTDEPRGGQKPDVLVVYEKIIRLQKNIDKLRQEYTKERERIQKIISKLDDNSYRIIELRYFENVTWERIADTLHYSVQHLHRLHSAVLTMLGNL